MGTPSGKSGKTPTQAIAVAFALVLAVAGCASGMGDATDAERRTTREPVVVLDRVEQDVYTYEGIEQWDEKSELLGGTLRSVMASMGKPAMDFDAFVASRLGEFAMRSFELVGYEDPAGLEVEEYWEARGMRHETHDADDADRTWTAIIPLDYDEDRSYPLLFCWHGNDNPVLLAEGYGIGQAAAERDWIVVFPWAANDDIHLAEFDRIYAYMTENFNIDASRVYSTGFSKGGATTANLARERSSLLAAAAPCGVSASVNSTLAGALSYGLPDADTGADSDAGARGSGHVPIMLFGGELDVFGAMPYDDAYKVDGINNYLAGFGSTRTQTVAASRELLAGADDETERAIGLSFDETETLALDGTTYHVGRYLDADGSVILQVVQCDGAIHWPTPAMGELVVDFLAHYAA